MIDLINIFKLSVKKTIKMKTIDNNYIFSYFIIPILNAFIFFMLHTNENISMPEVLMSVSIMTIWSINIFESSFLILGEKSYGTLNHIMLSKYKTKTIFFFEVLANLVFNFITVILIYIAGYLFKPYTIDYAMLGYQIIALTLTIVSIATIGLLLAVGLLYTRAARGIMNIIGYPFYILSGLFIPISNFPEAIKIIAYALPTTHAIELFRMKSFDVNFVGTKVLACIVLMILYHGLANLMFTHIEHKVAMKGDFDKF